MIFYDTLFLSFSVQGPPCLLTSLFVFVQAGLIWFTPTAQATLEEDVSPASSAQFKKDRHAGLRHTTHNITTFSRL